MPAVASKARHHDAERKRSSERSRERSLIGRDIGSIPACADPELRARCDADLLTFGLTCFPHRFTKPAGRNHLELVARAGRVIEVGGRFAVALPRGEGKTTWCDVSALWAHLTGRRRFIMLIGATDDDAGAGLERLKTELRNNRRLLELWPEVVYPYVCLEGESRRANGQLHHGRKTGIRWTPDEIVAGNIPGSRAAGSRIQAAGLTGSFRGKLATTDGLEQIRPDLAICDDPQTDESAKSPAQTEERLRLITATVAGLAGPGEPIGIIVPCTVVYPGDLADTLLDRDRMPDWQGLRGGMVVRWPDRQDLWDEYARLREESLRRHGDIRDATAYYAEHRAAMDAGGEAAWEHRYEPGELSALQHAWNKRLSMGPGFWAELMNQPEAGAAEEKRILTPAELAGRLSRQPRGVAGIDAELLTAFVDIQKPGLFFAVCAWTRDFAGEVVDYGAYPDQRGRGYFTLRDMRPTLAQKYPKRSLEAAIAAGLRDLLAMLEAPGRYQTSDGAPLPLSLVLVDANWSQSTAEVYSLARERPDLVKPHHGRGIGPGETPLIAYRKKPGERIGLHWIEHPRKERKARYVTSDGNWWKSFVHDRFRADDGADGTLRVFGTDPQAHRMFADHLTSEIPDRQSSDKTKRECDVWRLRHGAERNEYLDCVVGCAVAASMLGARVPGTPDVEAERGLARRARAVAKAKTAPNPEARAARTTGSRPSFSEIARQKAAARR